MAAFDTTRTTYGSATVANRFSMFLGSLIATVYSWNNARITRNALAALSDRELDDIGLIRGDIEAVADSNLIR
ncbi:MAG: DUF1127 domain-containing protein [Sulfitobacter sp.]